MAEDLADGGAGAGPVTGVEWVKARITLARFVAETHWSEAHEAAVRSFLDDRHARRLTAFVRKAAEGGADELVLEADATAVEFGDAATFAYFTRSCSGASVPSVKAARWRRCRV
jgi:hypothetical protein